MCVIITNANDTISVHFTIRAEHFVWPGEYCAAALLLLSLLLVVAAMLLVMVHSMCIWSVLVLLAHSIAALCSILNGLNAENLHRKRLHNVK